MPPGEGLGGQHWTAATAATSSTRVHKQYDFVHTPPSPSHCVSLRTATASQAKHSKQPSRSNLTTVALLRLYWPMLLLHSFWVIVEIGIRCAARGARVLSARVSTATAAPQQHRVASARHTPERAPQLPRVRLCALPRLCLITSRTRPTTTSLHVYVLVCCGLSACATIRLCRLSSPVLLKKYLTWLQGAAVALPGTATWPGWLWALGVAACGMGMTLVHHQFFW